MPESPHRVALVTGANRGIGRAIALRCAEAGYDVAVGYLSDTESALAVVSEVEQMGRRSIAVEGDVTDPPQARSLVARVIDEMGRIDALVNNAGIMPVTPFLEVTTEEWDQVIATDLSAAFHTIQAALPTMLEQGSGCVVNISSRLGQVGLPGVVPYAAAKSGLLGMTKSLAREFGPQGVRFNAVAPGFTLTEMTRDIVGTEEGERRLKELPAGRFGEPEDVAAAVVFLLSDEAEMFHGQTLGPNGGGYMP
ncbi:MAG TPA: 3-oxoacyl-ACP reductase family protein [Acidimicrobiia bacterium]|nr:3-oxoacyl-ACP reductase family protein [Acidimicrobiia bacterium]